MDNFKNIEDETLPSFLSMSRGSICSGILENMTFASTSTLGLPVAASTTAKSKSEPDNRILDVQASYLEDRKISLSAPPSPNGNGHNEHKDKFALSFKDDLEDVDKFIGDHRISDILLKVQQGVQQGGTSKQESTTVKNDATRCDITSLGILPLEENDGQLFSKAESKESRVDPGVQFLGMLKSKNTEDLFSDACSSLSSLLENEKLFTTSFEDSSTDIDEEELRHGLEAYFKQLVPPEMQRGPTEGHEMPDPEVLGMSLNLDPFCQENFRMPAIRLAAAGMDSASVSEDEDTDLEVRLRTSPDMCCLPPKSGTQLTEDCDHSSLRPGLEGGSSDEGNGTGSRNHRSSGGTVRRRSAEGQVISSLVTGDCGGDGSGSEEDGSIGGTTQYLSFSADPQSSFTVHDLGNADRKIVGEENGDLETPRTNRESVPGHQEGSLDDTSVQNGLSDKMKLDSLYFQKGANNWTLSEQTDASLPPVCQPSFSLSQILPSGNGHEPSLRAAACGFAEIRNAGKNCGVWDNAEAGLAAIYLSPSRQSENATDGYDSVEQQQPSEEKVTWSLEQLETDNSSSHVVYQNEKGKWVTDLAYYTSFDKYVRSDLPDDMILQLQEEEFIGGADAAALIAEDEDEFRKEHVFIQEEKMDLQDVSLGLGDTSWRLPSCNYILMRASQAASEFGKEDKSYLRLSLGQFFSQRSEALGCLGGGDGVKRPSFGYRIVSPEKRAPVALIRPSDISYPSSTDSDYPRDNTLLPEDLEVFEKEESKITSATFLIPESPCLTSAKGKNVNGTEAEGGSAAVSKDQIAESALDLKTLSANKPSSTGDSILSLSTIASAINDVSVNTNVSQVVAVFTELINKKKQLASEGYGKNEVLDRLQLSVAEALLQTNLEHTMEKKAKAEYFDAVLRGEIPHLNSSEVMGMSAALQAHSGQDYYNKEKAKELSHAIDLHLKHRDFSGRNDAPQETVIGSAACYGGLSIGERREVVIAKGKAAVATHKVANVDERVGDGARSGYMKGKRSVPSLFGTQVKESKAGMKGPCLSEMATFTCETDADKDVSNNKEIRNTLTENPKEYPKRKSAKVKELSGETVSSTGSSMLPGIVPAGAKMISHGHEINNPEDNQYSFRPSTSPLIHSSPSQTSGIPESTKSLSGSPVYTSTSIQELGCSDVTSSDFTYSSVCLSTESYSSFTDDTLQNSATIRSPEKIEGNKTIELSTTIVRSSPIPSPIPGREAGDLDSSFSKILGRKERVDSGCTWMKDKDNFTWKECPKNSENQEKAQEHKSRNLEEEHLCCNIANKLSDFQHIQPSSVANTPLTWHDYVNKVQSGELPPLGISSACNQIGLLPLSQNVPDTGYAQTAPFQPLGIHSSCAAVQSAHSGIPRIIAGRSLLTVPLAQQYLSTVPQVHAGAALAAPSSAVSLSAVLGTSMPPDQVQNPVSGYPAGAGFMQPSKPFCGDCGSEASGIGLAVVPEELNFATACCVGIAAQTSLRIHNPVDRWLQVSIGIVGISVNGEKMDPVAYQCLIMKNKTIVGPYSTEDLKVLFLPPHPGVFQCLLNVSSCSVSADKETVARAEALAVRVVLTAVAENPVIEVDSEQKACLNFGELSYGSRKTLPLKLLNRTCAVVPIRLVIRANAAAWQCYTFSKTPVHISCEQFLQTDKILRVSAPSVINHVMHANCEGMEPEEFVVYIHFHAPQRYLPNSDPLGISEELFARIDVELDSPAGTKVLKSIGLTAKVGTARIHAPKDLQTIYLCAKMGCTAKEVLPLKNAGNIAASLKIKTTNPEKGFNVWPEEISLQPGEEKSVEISFCPLNSESCGESILTVLVQPLGPQYEVKLKSEILKTDIPTLATTQEVPPVLSNRQFLAWGGVAMNLAVQQKLTLRNDSTNITQRLRLLVKGQDQDCFQLQSTFGSEERLTSSLELAIRPKEDASIYLLFAPTRVACMLAKLEIKPSRLHPLQPGIKFTIPLSGYGGTSNIILEGVKKLSDSYVATISIIPNRNSKVEFIVRNTGSRAAYVKIVCLTDLHSKALMDPKVLGVSPEQFILKENAHQMITLECCSTTREVILCNSSTGVLSCVCFVTGDEICRQQFRRSVSYKPEVAKQSLPENTILRRIDFSSTFPGEELVTEVYDLPQHPSDVQMFFRNTHKILLNVVGNYSTDKNSCEYEGSTVQTFTQPCYKSDSVPRSSEEHIGNMSLDVLPVKGPQGSPINVVDPLHKTPVESSLTWSIEPDHLILTAPSINVDPETGRAHIINDSSTDLRFELTWPGHCLTVTPHHGVIEPRSRLLVLVSPNSSLATRWSPAVLPWSGQIYVNCGGEQKIIKVQIREDATQDICATAVDTKQDDLPTNLETPVVNIAKHLSKSPAARVEIMPKMLTFPPTASGSCSEEHIQVKNLEEEAIRWYVMSFAPAYVKGVDESGDVYRATYSAFQCSCLSGTAARFGETKVPITFWPRDKGRYSQFWDFEYHPIAEPQKTGKIRFQLCGEGIRYDKRPVKSKNRSTTVVKTDAAVQHTTDPVPDLSIPKHRIKNVSTTLVKTDAAVQHTTDPVPDLSVPKHMSKTVSTTLVKTDAVVQHTTDPGPESSVPKHRSKNVSRTLVKTDAAVQHTTDPCPDLSIPKPRRKNVSTTLVKTDATVQRTADSGPESSVPKRRSKTVSTTLVKTDATVQHTTDPGSESSAPKHRRKTLSKTLVKTDAAVQHTTDPVPESSVPKNKSNSVSTALVKADDAVQTDTGLESSVPKKRQSEPSPRGVYAPVDTYAFPHTAVGESNTLKVNIRNNTNAAHMLKFVSPGEPFIIKYLKFELKSHHYINLPVGFKPRSVGKFEELLVVQTNSYGDISIKLTGESFAKV